MRTILLILFFFFTSFIPIQASVTYVSSRAEFDSAHDTSSPGDTIIWRKGTYRDIFMEVTEDQLTIKAEESGGTIFTGFSRVEIEADNITLEGFQYLDGDIGTRNVMDISGNNHLITQINISGYTCYKYLRVREESQYVDITYCNFENRLNPADQNILSILVDENQPGYHRVRFCSFKNFAGTGNDMGIEPIRIGVSTQAEFNSRSVVEYCYFTQCNGDGEIISSKAAQNVYRYNTFDDNPLAELVLRHGSENIVYGNFFLNGKGGVRVREGQNQYIFNNYFFNLDDRAIYLQNEDSDPLDNINIGFNTIIDCDEIRLGGNGSHPPTNVTFANNIFVDPKDDLFENATGSETWIGNMTFGDLGIPRPSDGLVHNDPLLIQNTDGFFGLSENSPAIDAAESGFPNLPSFMGIDSIDLDIVWDIMKQNRSNPDDAKDLGCSEYPHTISIKPIATAGNTGPHYLRPMTTSTRPVIKGIGSIIKVYPNPAREEINVSMDNINASSVIFRIVNSNGKWIRTYHPTEFFTNDNRARIDISQLSSGLYTLIGIHLDNKLPYISSQNVSFIKI